eukprot:1275783-Amphidinium_carterae.1
MLPIACAVVTDHLRLHLSRQPVFIASTWHGINQQSKASPGQNQQGGKGYLLSQAAGFTHCGSGRVC